MKRIDLVMACIVVGTVGCANTLWRYYEAVEEGNRWQVGDYAVEFHMEAYEIGNLAGHPLFRVRAKVLSVARYESEVHAAEAPIPWIDSILLTFPDSAKPIVLPLVPEVPKSIEDPLFLEKHRLLSTFFFEDPVLADPPMTVRLSFELVILDRTTHEVIRRIPVERELVLITKKKFWIHT